MESNYYQRDLQEELSNASSSINTPYHSAKTVFTFIYLQLLKIANILINIRFFRT